MDSQPKVLIGSGVPAPGESGGQGRRPELEARLQRIAASRARLDESVTELKSEASARLRLLHLAERRPLTAVGVATGAGFALGRLLFGRRRRAAATGVAAVAARASGAAGLGAGLFGLLGSAVATQVLPLLVEHAIAALARRFERRLGGDDGPADADVAAD